MQTLTIGASRPYGVPLNFTMLPEKLRQLGYTTHAVGKVSLFVILHACYEVKQFLLQHFLI